jgi:hypothetical protein
MTPRILALAASVAFAGSLFAGVPAAQACTPDYCPQTPTCKYVAATCIRPF